MKTEKQVINYTYENVVCQEVIDADTIDVVIDLGFNTYRTERIRFWGINAWETRGKEKEKGLKAKARLKELIEGKSIILETLKDKKGKYGRYLGIVVKDGININNLLVEEGHGIYKEY